MLALRQITQQLAYLVILRGKENPLFSVVQQQLKSIYRLLNKNLLFTLHLTKNDKHIIKYTSAT